MAVTTQCQRILVVLAFILVSLQISTAQIHWNRGWGAGGSTGKRSALPGTPNFPLIVPTLRLRQGIGHPSGIGAPWQNVDPNLFMIKDVYRSDIDNLESTERANRSNSTNDAKVGSADEKNENCYDVIKELAFIVAKLVEEETTKYLTCKTKLRNNNKMSSVGTYKH